MARRSSVTVDDWTVDYWTMDYGMLLWNHLWDVLRYESHTTTRPKYSTRVEIYTLSPSASLWSHYIILFASSAEHVKLRDRFVLITRRAQEDLEVCT
jgi:hypothetical protein